MFLITFQVPDNSETEYLYDYSDIWAEYDDTDDDDTNEETIPRIVEEQRINFAKYGKRSNETTNEDTKEVTDTLPDSIYCDLVTTLSAKCIQACIVKLITSLTFKTTPFNCNKILVKLFNDR